MRASPVGQPLSARHSSSSAGPAARWIAPSTPPPPSSVVLAAFTMASTACAVMSPWTASILAGPIKAKYPGRETRAAAGAYARLARPGGRPYVDRLANGRRVRWPPPPVAPPPATPLVEPGHAYHARTRLDRSGPQGPQRALHRRDGGGPGWQCVRLCRDRPHRRTGRDQGAPPGACCFGRGRSFPARDPLRLAAASSAHRAAARQRRNGISAVVRHALRARREPAPGAAARAPARDFGCRVHRV